jgi:hypothetical protein
MDRVKRAKPEYPTGLNRLDAAVMPIVKMAATAAGLIFLLFVAYIFEDEIRSAATGPLFWITVVLFAVLCIVQWQNEQSRQQAYEETSRGYSALEQQVADLHQGIKILCILLNRVLPEVVQPGEDEDGEPLLPEEDDKGDL